ncbi:MAG: UDP-N-acetylmuramoyl-L-alanyl-D-glutamate--2,6-diaminopimelate ligase [Oscillospiraceae bacterium]|nr:UDP-N-acetylmuramoyl-L-alanyl-D-glutamate--2,6-diaminopimelate ligase [Oscillospiraceae bacterium]
MKLKELLRGMEILQMHADPEINIHNVVYDTRKTIMPGDLFVAISGFAFDGNSYIEQAMAQGAVAVVTAKKPEKDIPYILVSSDRMALAMLGINFFGEPAKSMKMIGVTGTNGKTSVTLLTKHVLERVLGAKVGLIGTMENLIGQEVIPTERTTPENFELQQLFAAMRSAGCEYCVMEVSSHAIALDRVGGVEFDVAAFTNLSEDHLIFHKTMENYCDTKAQLFHRCKAAVFNRDDSWYSRISAGVTCPVITTAAKSDAMLRAENVSMEAQRVSFTAVYKEEKVAVSLPIPGGFTVYNALTVLGIVLQLGISLTDAAAALATASGVKGRVEVVPTPGKPYTVLIDYAHTPDGLENVLSSVRKFCKGRLIAVFGCGGDRDSGKRPVMGKIGTDLSDFAVITSDNPRNEDPNAIIQDILKGITRGSDAYVVIEDRRKAIRYAMDKAEKNDIIVLAGKGHETYQEIRGVKYPLDERVEVNEYLSETEN